MLDQPIPKIFLFVPATQPDRIPKALASVPTKSLPTGKTPSRLPTKHKPEPTSPTTAPLQTPARFGSASTPQQHPFTDDLAALQNLPAVKRHHPAESRTPGRHHLTLPKQRQTRHRRHRNGFGHTQPAPTGLRPRPARPLLRLPRPVQQPRHPNRHGSGGRIFQPTAHRPPPPQPPQWPAPAD